MIIKIERKNFLNDDGTLKLEYAYTRGRPAMCEPEAFKVNLDTSKQEIVISSCPNFEEPYIVRRNLSSQVCRTIENSGMLRRLVNNMQGHSFKSPTFDFCEYYESTSYSLSLRDKSIYSADIYEDVDSSPLELVYLFHFIHELSCILITDGIWFKPNSISVDGCHFGHN